MITWRVPITLHLTARSVPPPLTPPPSRAPVIRQRAPAPVPAGSAPLPRRYEYSWPTASPRYPYRPPTLSLVRSRDRAVRPHIVCYPLKRRTSLYLTVHMPSLISLPKWLLFRLIFNIVFSPFAPSPCPILCWLTPHRPPPAPSHRLTAHRNASVFDGVLSSGCVGPYTLTRVCAFSTWCHSTFKPLQHLHYFTHCQTALHLQQSNQPTHCTGKRLRFPQHIWRASLTMYQYERDGIFDAMTMNSVSSKLFGWPLLHGWRVSPHFFSAGDLKVSYLLRDLRQSNKSFFKK